MCGLELGRRFASHLLADEVGGSLLLEPHGDAVATTRRADHVTVVVQNDVDSGAIGQIEDIVETLHESWVQGVALCGLSAGPDNTQANGVEPEILDVVHIGLVEVVAGLFSGRGAIESELG